jgi:hypothetical protein
VLDAAAKPSIALKVASAVAIPASRRRVLIVAKDLPDLA